MIRVGARSDRCDHTCGLGGRREVKVGGDGIKRGMRSRSRGQGDRQDLKTGGRGTGRGEGLPSRTQAPLASGKGRKEVLPRASGSDTALLTSWC